jgi:hypothetical protein
MQIVKVGHQPLKKYRFNVSDLNFSSLWCDQIFDVELKLNVLDNKHNFDRSIPFLPEHERDQLLDELERRLGLLRPDPLLLPGSFRFRKTRSQESERKL